ncbi:MAG TPA: DUF2490 domain-containing protein, partial [Flavobacteriales bacterium]|nr:DUF2490 domain-containing protein [Flavobacteriales bacterium]
MKRWCVALAVLAVTYVTAQHTTADQFNAWASSNIQVQVGERWWATQEVHWRRNEGFTHPMQTAFLFGLEYRRGPWAVMPGYTFWYNYPYGAFPSSATQREHRFWLQGAYKHSTGRGTFEHRIRIEDRLLERFTASADGPRSQGFEPVGRVRYRAQLTWPLNTKKDVAGELTAVLAQETFVRFGDPRFMGAFDQSRSIAQLGWRCAKHIRLLAGYQFQY